MDNQQVPKADSEFQKIARKNHRKWKIRLLSGGGQKADSGGGPYKKKPNYNRAKSAPPGFGGSLEESEQLDEVIRKKDGKYCLFSKKTKRNLGCYPTRAGAMKREKQVQYFKHLKEQIIIEELEKALLQEKDGIISRFFNAPFAAAEKLANIANRTSVPNIKTRGPIQWGIDTINQLDRLGNPSGGTHSSDNKKTKAEQEIPPTTKVSELAKKYNLKVSEHLKLGHDELVNEFGGQEKYEDFLEKIFEENKDAISGWTKEKTFDSIKKGASSFSVEPHVIAGILMYESEGLPIGLTEEGGDGTRFGMGKIDLTTYESIKDKVGVPHYLIWIPGYGIKATMALFSKLLAENGAIDKALIEYTGSEEEANKILESINNVTDLFENKRMIIKFGKVLTENRIQENAILDMLDYFGAGTGSDKEDTVIDKLNFFKPEKLKDTILGRDLFSSQPSSQSFSQTSENFGMDVESDLKLSKKELQAKFGGFEGYIEFLWKLFDENKSSLSGWTREDSIKLINEIAPKYGLEPYIAIGVMTGESGLTPTGVYSQTMRSRGDPAIAIRANSTAYGMGGVTHSTYEQYKNTIGVPHYMIWIPKYGIEASIATIAGNLRRWNGDLEKAMINYAGTEEGGYRKVAAIEKARQKYGSSMLSESKKITIKFGEVLSEAKKKEDRCVRIAKSKYDAWPSAYASGAVVKCRQGKIWKGIKEAEELEEDKEKIKHKLKKGIVSAVSSLMAVNPPAGSMKPAKEKPAVVKKHKKDLDEEWSEKYKKSIDCKNPKGFSQKAHCQGRKKKK